MTAIVFDCTKGCGAVLSADLGAQQDFGPCATDDEALEHARRRREYLGTQVEVALLEHLLLDCPIATEPRDTCVICAGLVDPDGDQDVCTTCTALFPTTTQRQQGGQR